MKAAMLLIPQSAGVLAKNSMLMALAEGETNPATLAALADERLRAAPADLIEQLNKMHPLDQVKCVQRLARTSSVLNCRGTTRIRQAGKQRGIFR